MSESSGRGATWLAALTESAAAVAGYPRSVRVVDALLADQPCRYIAVLPDESNPYPRARTGEVGLIEGWALAKAVHQAIDSDLETHKRTIVAVVDVSSQAYGRREEAFGIHAALAGAAGAYAKARQAGHAVIALIVGKAMSGAFLAHGYQASPKFASTYPFTVSCFVLDPSKAFVKLAVYPLQKRAIGNVCFGIGC